MDDHGLVYFTGGHESYFISLYLLAIIVASILFSRRDLSHRRVQFCASRGNGRAGFLRQAAADSCSPCPAPARCKPGSSAISLPLWPWPIFRVFWRKHFAARELSSNKRAASCKILRAFNEDIIHSMRGGLLTTDSKDDILLLNRPERKSPASVLRMCEERFNPKLWPGFWSPGESECRSQSHSAQEIDFTDRGRASNDFWGFRFRRCEPATRR